MKRIVVFSGAGISRESGIQTFRDGDGLWEGHRVEDVATPEAWSRDSSLVLDFYDQRRRSVLAAEPNRAHKALVSLEDAYLVDIITQNIDDLHERAGSSRVLHLHGELLKARSTVDPDELYDIEGPEIDRGARCSHGGPLRPHVVWFGESVPMLEPAARITQRADIFIVVGSSLVVYPAAGLVREAVRVEQLYLVDPRPPEGLPSAIEIIEKSATEGVSELADRLLSRVEGL